MVVTTNEITHSIIYVLFFLSLQTSTQRRCKLPWPNTRRRRWPSPCPPSAAPLTHHHRLKPARLQAGKERGMSCKELSNREGHAISALSRADSSSGSEDESSVPRQSSAIAPPSANANLQSPDAWINRTCQGSSTSSSASSTLSHGEAKPQPQYKAQFQPLYQPQYQPQHQRHSQQHEQPPTAVVTNMLSQSHIGETLHHRLLGERHRCLIPPCSSLPSSTARSESRTPPPDVTAAATVSRGPRVDLPSNAVVRGMSRGQSRSSMMETADGNNRSGLAPLCASARASARLL